MAPANPQGIPPNELSAMTIEFKYDGLSRLVERKVTRGIDPPEVEGYQWDGWKLIMIAKLNTNGTFHSRKWSCVWRPDVGSSLYARSDWMRAGGVGGVAWMQTGAVQSYSYGTGSAEVHVPLADHMGNVRHYYQFKSTKGNVTGQLVASYEYDAFGREVRAWGLNTPTENQPPGLPASRPWADLLPFHYSSKLRDADSGFNYYGYRFYDPGAGRWLNRDPIEEKGGVNLYGMVGNDAVGRVDLLGLFETPFPFNGQVCNHCDFPVAVLNNGVWRTLASGKCTAKNRETKCDPVPLNDDIDGVWVAGQFSAVASGTFIACKDSLVPSSPQSRGLGPGEPENPFGDDGSPPEYVPSFGRVATPPPPGPKY